MHKLIKASIQVIDESIRSSPNFGRISFKETVIYNEKIMQNITSSAIMNEEILAYLMG